MGTAEPAGARGGASHARARAGGEAGCALSPRHREHQEADALIGEEFLSRAAGGRGDRAGRQFRYGTISLRTGFIPQAEVSTVAASISENPSHPRSSAGYCASRWPAEKRGSG